MSEYVNDLKPLVKMMDDAYEELLQQKEKAVAYQDFALAAFLRMEGDRLKQQITRLKEHKL